MSLKNFSLFCGLSAVLFFTFCASADKTKKQKNDFDFDSYDASSPASGNAYICVEFNAKVFPEALNGAVEFTPPVKISSIRGEYDWAGGASRQIRIDGEFKPGAAY